MSERKQLTSPERRRGARYMRNRQWQFMARVVESGTIWVCWWDKKGRYSGRYAKEAPPSDMMVCGLIDAMEWLAWFKSHADWWVIGVWSDERYAAPISITEAGRAAYADRTRYDMEPVIGGLVEPGWMAIPAEGTHEPA